jgi:hypothetical protein
MAAGALFHLDELERFPAWAFDHHGAGVGELYGCSRNLTPSPYAKPAPPAGFTFASA